MNLNNCAKWFVNSLRSLSANITVMKVKDILVEESNVQPVSAPVTICGDIHGQVMTGGELPGQQIYELVYISFTIFFIFSKVAVRCRTRVIYSW